MISFSRIKNILLLSSPLRGRLGGGLGLLLIACLVLVACSTDKNTAQSRWWNSFTARYNTYYNGSQAYIDGALEKENGNKDNFTEMIPLYTVGNKSSRETGKGKFDVAIEKSQKAIRRHSIKKRPEWTKSRKKTERDIEWLNRKEYNPFLWKAWLMMGKSQFMKGAFDEAASTFTYMSRMYSTQPAIYGKARAWLAKSYIQQDWLYDAEDIIKKMSRDSIDWRAQKEWNYTMADYYIHTEQYAEAIPYLQKVIKRESRAKQKAREYFLLGQLYSAVDQSDDAYKAYRSCARSNPPYELEFNARIAMTEVAAEKNAKGMISLLKRMARNDNNKEYLDQVYYAIGNIYLAQKDTVNAISAYEKGSEKATRSGIEKGVLLLRLGDIYCVQEKYSDAKRCYGEAIGLLDKDRDDYEQLARRSKILDELVPHTDAIHLNDSLLALSVMPEKERNAAIDRVIEALKKKEKEEKDRLAEQEAAQQQAKNGGNPNQNNRNQNQNRQQTNNNNQESTFYFYNQMAVNQGKQQFQRLWGNRANEDDWQRINKTVVSNEPPAPSGSVAGLEDLTEEQRDSIMQAEAKQDSIDNEMEKPENDPHKREYYLAQIPFKDEQKADCHKAIADGLYNSAVIFKDKLDNLPLSEKQFARLMKDYPDYEKNADIYYHSYLLFNRKNQPDQADTYLQLLKDSFPDNEWTKILSDPYFKENALYGKHLEDSLYAETYNSFKKNDFPVIYRNYTVSTDRYPLGDNRDKFLFIQGLSRLNDGDADSCLACMKTVVDKHPKSSVQPLAGMIINGVKEGRRLHGGRFDMGDVWSRRTSVMADSDSIAARKFEADLDIPYTFMFAYAPDSLSATVLGNSVAEPENKLLFELARFNFTTFMVRNFEIHLEEIDGLHRMMVNGFQSYQEARQYARQLYAQSSVIPILAAKARAIIISDKNLELLGTQYSYNDYDEFYETHYVPLKLSTVVLLNEPIMKREEPDETDEPEETPTDAPAEEEADAEESVAEEPVVESQEDFVPVTQEIVIPTDPVEPEITTEVEVKVEPEKEVTEEENTIEIQTEDTPQNEDDEIIVVFDDDNTNIQTDDNIIIDDNTVVTDDPQSEDNDDIIEIEDF